MWTVGAIAVGPPGGVGGYGRRFAPVAIAGCMQGSTGLTQPGSLPGAAVESASPPAADRAGGCVLSHDRFRGRGVGWGLSVVAAMWYDLKGAFTMVARASRPRRIS